MALAPLAVSVPLAVAAALAGVGKRLPRAVPTLLALATSLAVAVMCAVLVVRARAGLEVDWMGGWGPRDGIAVGVALTVDPIGAGLGCLSALMMSAALLFALGHIDEVHALFDALMLAFLAALVAFGLTGDLFDLFVFFELMSAAAYTLCGYKSDERGPLQGALNFAVTNTVGATLGLAGLALVYGRTGALNFAHIALALGAHRDALVVLAFWLVACGFLVKAAVFPFHFWLDDAHAVAPTPVSVMFSGVMVTAGLYGVARVWWSVFGGALAPDAATVRGVLMALGAATALIGGAMCWAQRHIKRLLAFSTIAHVGVMTLGVAALSPRGLAGACVYALGHGFVKGALFVLAGILLHTRRSVDEIALRGRGDALTGVLWGLAALGLAGLPPFGTFLGTDAVVRAAREAHRWVGPVIALASALTASAVLRAGGRVFLGWGPRAAEIPGGGENTEEPETDDAAPGRVPWTMTASAALLLALSLAVGLVPRVHHAALAAAAHFCDSASYARAVMAGGARAALDAAPPAPSAPEPARAFVVLLASLALALGALFRERLPRRVRASARAAAGAIYGVLRRAHSGHVGDYVTWLILGIATISVLAEIAAKARG